MRKVGEVLREIEELENHSKVISDIVNKMSNDNDIRKYMMETFRVDTNTMSSIASKISIRAMKLKDGLKECQVDID